MKQELIDQLISKYPNTLNKIKYIECSDGWYYLLDNLLQTIESYLITLPVEMREQVFAEQIKQKFGYLRVYFSKNLHYISGAIDMAEALSKLLCEECGHASGQLRQLSWMQVLCDVCFDKDNKRRKEEYEFFIRAQNKKKV